MPDEKPTPEEIERSKRFFEDAEGSMIVVEEEDKDDEQEER